MGKTYNQTLDSSEASLAIERFLIAPYGTSYSPAKMDFSTPPTGFYDMGTVVEDSPTIRVRREKYQLELGIPRILAYEMIRSVNAEIEFSVYSNTNWNAQFALGNSAFNTVSAVTTATSAAQWIGKSQILNYAIIGVADFINGAQVVHYFPKVSPAGDWEEMFRPDAVNGMKYTFNALGYETTIDSCTHLVCGVRYYYGPGGACIL